MGGGTKDEVAALPSVIWGDGTDKETSSNMLREGRKDTIQGEGTAHDWGRTGRSAPL